jgi:hypothetical protein
VAIRNSDSSGLRLTLSGSIGFTGTATGWTTIKLHKPPPPAVLPPDSLWHRVYLLYYYDKDGECRLTTWDDGPEPQRYIHVVVTGPTEHIPLWDSPVVEGLGIEPMPPELDHVSAGGRKEYRELHARRLAYAASKGGVWACGWLLDYDLKRMPPRSFWWSDEEYAEHLKAIGWVDPDGKGR